MNVPALDLQARIPVAEIASLSSDISRSGREFEAQLNEWGFMGVNVPGIGRRVADLLNAFRLACSSAAPSLEDFSHSSVPQLASGGNHGFFPFWSEVPRLAKGVPDPKEHLHISGAMLDDLPPGAADMLRAFPTLGVHATDVFDVAFTLATAFGDVVRGLMSEDAPNLGLSHQASILRVIHYVNSDGREVLAHEHSGIQMLGIQLPPTDGGLQYVLNDGTWVEPVLAGTDVVLCNIGRMLTFASSGRFRPSTHRVHRGASPGYERWSSVLFVYPSYEERQWTAGDLGVQVLERTWGDFIADRFAGLTGSLPDPA
ncbi:MAG TPA: 2OG-Fe(II) oxygenase family protein [Micromonosporaceae bacterium]